jgi:hypothetical protein
VTIPIIISYNTEIIIKGVTAMYNSNTYLNSEHPNENIINMPFDSVESDEPDKLEVFYPDGHMEWVENPPDLLNRRIEPRFTVPTNFQKITLHKGGDDANCAVVTFMGDGFTASQQGTFETEARKVANFFLKDYPFYEFNDAINIYAIKVISNQSGVGSSPTATVDNFFGSRFNSAS